MKTNKLSYTFSIIFLVLLVACSTKKDRFINRQFQALNTKYNVMYNGNMALDKGIDELKLKYSDNFWEVLPIERMQPTIEEILPGQQKNANFDRAEEKATKAIQKRSMNIDGKEKNPQMDEAHLLLGKSRYYDNRFVPALEAFNYILYKYPESDKIYEAKIWRERTNMRMENDALAVKNLRKLLGEIKFKDQIFADANATLAQAFLNVGEKDSAVVRLRMATQFTKSNEEKARYRFILGQLYEQAGQKDSAYVTFQSIIDMKRKSPRRYVIQAHAKQGLQYDFEKGDTLAFLEKYNDLLKDRENRPYLDILNHQMGLFYDKRNKHDQAIKFYNKSLRTNSQDLYLTASNYRNLADIHFDTAKYQDAGLYYDSTLVKLQQRTREYRLIKKKRENLADVIKYEAIAQKNDSILNVVSLSEADKKGFYDDYIERLKKSEKKKADLAKKMQEKAERENRNSDDGPDLKESASGKEALTADAKGNNVQTALNKSAAAAGNKDANSFYFYSTSTVAYGKLEFKKKWGGRSLKDNWRLASLAKLSEDKKEEANDSIDENTAKKQKETEPKYTADFYIKQLPTSLKVIDSLSKERNFAYYQLGVVYKEKFKEYKLAASKLEQLLKNNPEERLVLPAMYNLYKIYEIIDKEKALAMKSKVISQFPVSRYAQILSSSTNSELNLNNSPEKVYQDLYSIYEKEEYIRLLTALDEAIDQFTGEAIIPKLEILKTSTIGKLKGLTEYKAALNFVALNYPSSEEGKEAERLLSKNLPKLERLQFDAENPTSWKIIYKVSNSETPEIKKATDIIKKFALERTSEKLSSSIDTYSMTENFLVIHGIGTEEKAKEIATILKDYKDYLIQIPGVVISSENYKVVQIKKVYAEYLLPHEKPKVYVDEPETKESAKPETNPQSKKQGNKNAQRNAKEKQQNNPEQDQMKEINSEDPVPEKSLPPTPKKPK